ncbi:MAG: glycosyltransferase family 9 protein [Candidatus Zixiibacteriota bacterium]|nr:MAG: glycosyltransferase family 9 protein [candidate division Zixibacteria bacterium]
MSKLLDLDKDDGILISRTDRLGDLVLALPFVETIKERYPECRVDVISSLYASPILENNRRINKILRVQNDQLLVNKLYKKNLLQSICREKYKVVIVLYPERQISRLFYKAEIPYRIGTAGRFHSVFFNTHLMHSRKKNLKHEFEYNFDFLKFFRRGKTIRFPNVYLREKELKNARRILNDAGVKEDFVVIHPGSGGSAERWPVENFIRLYKLLEKEGVDLVVSGSEQEGAGIEAVCGQLNMPIRKITGETDLRTLAAVLSLAHVVVANSTGPLHLAVAAGTAAVGLYPSRKAMSPLRWGPLGNSDKVIQPVGVECECPPRRCICMETIKPERVMTEVLDLLNKTDRKLRL